MSQYTFSIAQPCYAVWQEMTPMQQGKYCERCEQQVTDFTKMTDYGVKSWVRNLFVLTMVCWGMEGKAQQITHKLNSAVPLFNDDYHLLLMTPLTDTAKVAYVQVAYHLKDTSWDCRPDWNAVEILSEQLRPWKHEMVWKLEVPKKILNNR